MAKEQQGERRERGKGFPKVSLHGAIKVVEEAYKFGRKFTKDGFAVYGTKRGGGSARSGAYFNRLAALTDFALIVQRGGSVELTDLAVRIVAPAPGEDKTLAIQQAFMACDIFRNIHSQMARDKAVAADQVANLASREFGVAAGRRDEFAKSFILSGEYAGLLKVGEGGLVTLLGPRAAVPGETEAEGGEAGGGEGERRPPSGQPVVDQFWGDEATGVRLVVYSGRPLQPADYKSLGEVAEKIEQFFHALQPQKRE